MRRIVAILLIGSIGATLASAPATAGKNRKGKRAERTVEAAYSTPAAGVPVAGDFYAACVPDEGIGCVSIVPRMLEIYARIEIEDTLGQPVHGFITSRDGTRLIAELCGDTDKFVLLGTDLEFLVWVFAGPCGDGSPAFATSGTVTATLSKQP
jgi:hypothetical protein